MPKKRTYRSPIAAAMHESVSGMYRLGLVDEATMRKFDESCIVVAKPAKVKSCSRRTVQPKASKK